MRNKIFRLFIALAVSSFLISSCKEDDKEIKGYSSVVVVANTSLQFDKFALVTKFSTDNGATFVDYPSLTVGQKYQVKVFNPATEWISQDEYLTTANHYSFDWSSSNPKPVSGGTSDVAEFIASESNEVILNVSDACAFTVADWAGTYDAVEDYGSSTYGPYDLTLVQDSENPNKFFLDNFYDSGLDPYIVFNGEAGTVTFPEQETGGKPITGASGVYKQCTGEIVFSLVFDSGTTHWHYRLVKQ